MRRDQLPEHKRPTYVMPQYKAVYVAVSKAACTSLKWLVADVQGEDPERFYSWGAKAVTRDMCIHHRGGFVHTPMLHSLADRELAEISPDNGWFVFTVVRHPSARLFSAWQSKLLLREPRWPPVHGGQPWFPRVPRSTQDVVEDFQRFAIAMAADPGQKIMRDRHFMPQWREAAPERVPYSRVYDTSEIPVLMGDLERHLRAQGYEGDLRLKESNETPLKPLRSIFSDEVAAALRALYPEDFEGFGYDDVLPRGIHPAESYPQSSLDEIRRLIERHERIADLADRAKDLQSDVVAARQAARTPSPGALDRARSVASRLRRRLGSAPVRH